VRGESLTTAVEALRKACWAVTRRTTRIP